MPELSSPNLNNLGLALIVCGAAFVCSGLVFLLLAPKKAREQDLSFKESIEEINGHLEQMRREPGDFSDGPSSHNAD